MRYSIARFWRERKSHYKLLGKKCLKCGKINYPPGRICRYCGSDQLEDIELLDKGRIVTWSTIYAAPVGFEEYKPIIIAVVELLKTRVKILTRLVDVEPSEVREGMIVEPVLRRISEDRDAGLIHYGIVYRPSLLGDKESE